MLVKDVSFAVGSAEPGKNAKGLGLTVTAVHLSPIGQIVRVLATE